MGVALSSCIEDDAPEDAFGQGPNLVSFRDKNTNFTAVATGEEYVKTIPMKIVGPSIDNISGPVTATISVDPSSTAEEGVHFRLDQKTITFSSENDYLNLFPVTMLSEGIDPPLAEDPVLVLNISDATGDGNVIANGTKMTIRLLYLCNSQLEGTYEVTGPYYRDGVFQGIVNYSDVLRKTGEGEYRGTKVGHWGDLGVGNPGFTFLDVCDNITIPEQNLVDYYANIVEGVPGKSFVNPENGNLYMEYTICYGGSCREYFLDYVKQ